MTKYLIIALIVFSVVGAVYFKYSQGIINTLHKNNAILEQAVKTNEDTIIALQEDYSKAQEITSSTNVELSAIRLQNSALVTKLSEHDLELLANKKPELISKIINKASKNSLRCFELLSGAPYTDEEMRATSAKTFNSECPWLFYSP